MNKKLFFILCIFYVNVFAIPVEVIANAPAEQKEIETKLDALTSLQGLIQAVNTSQSLQQQIKALDDLNKFQQDPANAVNLVNNTISSMLHSFNLSAGTNFTNLQQLIDSLSGSSSTKAASLKLMQASNIQLMTISNTLQQMQATQVSAIAYKQAEIVQDKYQQEQNQRNINATLTNMQRF